LTDQPNVALEAWVRLLRGHAATRRTLSAQLLSDHGLTVNDYEALLLLSKEDDGHLRRVEERFAKDELAMLAELLGRLPGAPSADGSECTPG
jgi:hypothetical protein